MIWQKKNKIEKLNFFSTGQPNHNSSSVCVCVCVSTICETKKVTCIKVKRESVSQIFAVTGGQQSCTILHSRISLSSLN
jgi:hypothetical protein